MTESDRALAATLTRDEAELAERTVQREEQRRPDMFAAYPPEGRKRCVEDTVFHLQHLGVALVSGDASLFGSYRDWLVALLGARGIGEEHVDDNFAVLGEVLREKYGQDAEPALRLLRG